MKKLLVAVIGMGLLFSSCGKSFIPAKKDKIPVETRRITEDKQNNQEDSGKSGDNK